MASRLKRPRVANWPRKSVLTLRTSARSFFTGGHASRMETAGSIRTNGISLYDSLRQRSGRAVRTTTMRRLWQHMEPFTGGVGPAGSSIASLDAGRHADLRERCRSMLPVAPFALKAQAWAARGLA